MKQECFIGDYAIHSRLKTLSRFAAPWGYGGSGPADFAWNILSIFLGQEEAEQYYMAFKFEVVSALPREGGTIKRDFILEWIEKKRKEAQGV